MVSFRLARRYVLSLICIGLLSSGCLVAQSPAPAIGTNGPAEPIVTPPIAVQSNAEARTETNSGSESVLHKILSFDTNPSIGHHDSLGSTYIPVDSWVYVKAVRLYSLGYLDHAYVSMRPWTRRSLLHQLEDSTDRIVADQNQEALEILAKLNEELGSELLLNGSERGAIFGSESFYTRLMGIKGQTLRDSYHLGQTIVNDYGRPYEPGFNNITGFSSVNEWKRFSLNIRGEYQHSPSANGYSLNLANTLSCNLDTICPFAPPNAPQATIPYGTIQSQNPFRLQEASLSFHLLGHEISGGKSDAWIGPGLGGAMAWSNNAENIYSFRINRVEPLHIPLVSALLGPVRYDFFVGSLKGHTSPNSPWVHQEAIEVHPTANLELGFQRTVIWGGKNHEPVTLHTFLKSFFDISDTTQSEKSSALDPGARFTAFNFSWRLPFIRDYATLYVDSEAHDDVTPISAPRRAAYRPGIVLTKFPKLPRLGMRVEAADTDPPTLRSMTGHFNYFEGIQTQGYTNKGFIFGDWIGREAKGGQIWLTYHLSGNEWVQLEYLNKKNPKDFIPGGTTQNQFKVEVDKRFRKNLELNAWLQWERWKAPIYIPGSTNDVVVAGQLTFWPGLKTIQSRR